MIFRRAHRSFGDRSRAGVALHGLGVVASAVLIASPVRAATPASFSAMADQPLAFGTIVAAAGGSRTIGADGSSSDDGVFPLGSSTSSPAQFTMTFNRASGDRTIYQLIFLFSLPTPSNANVGGVQGTVSTFTTDLPGVPRLLPGQIVTYILPNCTAASCSVTFHVGGTLNVTPASTGARLTFPLVLQTTVTAVLG